MSGANSFKVVWVAKDGTRHEDDEYFSETVANLRAIEIMAEHRADIHRIWLQGRKVQL